MTAAPKGPEVTPEMREAGLAALEKFQDSLSEQLLVDEVYRAMWLASPWGQRLADKSATRPPANPGADVLP